MSERRQISLLKQFGNKWKKLSYYMGGRKGKREMKMNQMMGCHGVSKPEAFEFSRLLEPGIQDVHNVEGDTLDLNRKDRCE
jgi:hypothetical protein